MLDSPPHPTEEYDIPSDMTTVYLCLLKRGPVWSAEESEVATARQAAHLAHLRRLSDAGSLIMAGPLGDNGDIRGICIYRVGSQAEAQSLADADPAVQAGHLVAEIHPWHVSESVLPKQTATYTERI